MTRIVCIRYSNDKQSNVARKLITVSLKKISLCDIVKAELYYGAYKSARRTENLTVLRQFFEQLISLPFDGAAAEMFGSIRSHLFAAGTPIGPYDMQIVAIALANNLILVTHNTSEFTRVPNLQIEDWEV